MDERTLSLTRRWGVPFLWVCVFFRALFFKFFFPGVLPPRVVQIGFARVLCVRITYLGELGYELYVPAEQAGHVYDRILSASAGCTDKDTDVDHHDDDMDADPAEDLGLVHCGLKALGSLRMEKGYRDYGHDLDNTDTLLEAGLGFTADFDKPGGFIGKEAVLAQRASLPGGSLAHLPKRMVQVLLEDPEPMMYHAEVVYRDGVVVGDVRAASYGHTLGGAVGLSMVERKEAAAAAAAGEEDDKRRGVSKKWIESGVWEVDVAGTRYPARVSLQPMYDPRNVRIKA